ncbi:Crp/Fnr family transcriptional regulator [Sporocytophaga myxococcoides]|uniref:Crp/Fnr family transcriptional regulator n=1 Tax=Sporocytophaga myxococcoides TaxID=153721 RepID=UPI0003FC1F33|nr:Crp/Fnr family transcriptional regulator [Sporocytophaga myxococcoides]
MNTLSDITPIINAISENYSPLSESCKTDIQKKAKVLILEKPAILVKEGQFADKAYFLIKGCARAFYLKDGKDISDWFAFEGDFICSINSFFLNIPSPHAIETLEPAVLLELSRDHIQSLSDQYHDFEKLINKVVVKTLLQLQQRIVSIQFETAHQKFENLLKITPDITQRVPLTHIASYLGITLETLSRIRNPKNRI